MAHVVDFLAFATGGGANVQTQSDFASDATTTQGFASGTAISSHVNKVWRQSSFWAAVLANFTSNQLAIDVLDDGNLSGKITNFQNAILQLTSVYALLASPHLTGVPTAPTAAGGTNTTQIATTAFVATALAGYATLASPTFTGSPLAPTPAGSDNSTKIATTAFVVTALAGYAKLAGPTFTGVPTAPTAAGGTNTQQIATCAFVQSALTPIASQADMEAASSNVLVSPPGRLLYHPGMAKAWVAFKYVGTTFTVLASYNCTASRTGVGLFTVTFTGITFSSANYAAVGSATDYIVAPFNPTTNNCSIRVEQGGGTAIDPVYAAVSFFGDLA